MARVTTETDAGRRRLSAEERRERILEAAQEVFAARGYEAASIGEIAKAAGIAPSVIYDHFPSKRNLHMELLQRQATELFELTTRPVQNESFEERVRWNIEAFFGFVEEHPFAWRMLFRDVGGDPEIADFERNRQREATKGLARLFATLPEVKLAGDVGREVADEMIAETVKSATNGLAGWWYEHRQVTREQVVDLAMRLLWNGLKDVPTK